MLVYLLKITIIQLFFLVSGLNTNINEDESLIGELKMHATINSIGVVFEYNGDDNRDNQATMEYRSDSHPSWLRAHDLTVNRSAREWKGSLVQLNPGVLYQVRIFITDPDGVSTGIITGEITTRPDAPEYGLTGTNHFVPDEGSLDSVLENAEPGDRIYLRSGTYYTNVILNDQISGDEDEYISIEAEPGGEVILDGSDPELNNPLIDNWVPYQGNIYYSELPWADANCTDQTLPGYVGQSVNGDSVRYLMFEGAERWGDFINSPPGSAFYDCNQRLYVKTYEGDDPDMHEMQVSMHRHGIVLAGADHIRIKNLEIRYFSSYGIYFANPGADHNVIENNIFHGIGVYHIRIGASTPKSSNNLIQDNLFYEKGYRDSHWTWNLQYRRANVTGIRLLDAGPGNVIRRNSLISGTDGISIVNQSHETDVYHNTIFDCMDDGIEVDNEPGGNIRIWGNKISYCYSGISTQDWFTGRYLESGPVYIFRNEIKGGNDPHNRSDLNGEIYSTAYAFKVGSDMDFAHHVYYYHNAIDIPDSDVNGNGFQDAGGMYFSGAVTRNNKLRVTRYVFNLRRQSTTRDHDFDCDSLFSSRLVTGSPFIQWTRRGGPDENGTYDDLLEFQVSTGQEINGISGIQTNDIFNIRSPEIDSGCEIPGFNTSDRWGYLGRNPDIGDREVRLLNLLISITRVPYFPR